MKSVEELELAIGRFLRKEKSWKAFIVVGFPTWLLLTYIGSPVGYRILWVAYVGGIFYAFGVVGIIDLLRRKAGGF